ncbi:MAG TPA: sulfotransferase [Terriglobales bacterium]
MTQRKHAPVFVIGCHRSGTNLLYDTLLSSGGFAVYRASSTVYETLLPHFGSFSVTRNREKLMQAWCRSKPFRRSGLNPELVRDKVLNQCRSGGDFLRIVMEEIARKENASRWAVYNPDNALYIPAIKRDLPDALFVHIIRDGRDVSLSLTKMQGLRPFRWDRARHLFATALYWEWMVKKGRTYGRMFPGDYLEVHYEDLVRRPHATLETLGNFLDHDLDLDRIQSAGVGSVRKPNSTFASEAREDFNPVNRWREKLSQREISMLETLIGDCLEELSYPLTSDRSSIGFDPRVNLMRILYPNYFSTKLWLKTHTPLGRLASIDVLEVRESHEPAVAQVSQP